jgi:cyanophycinase
MNAPSTAWKNALVTLVAGALSCLAPITATQADGPLLIVGGALRDDNAAVYRALIDGMLPQGPLVIIPAASGRPARSAAGMADTLAAHGLARDRIDVFPLAVRDDSQSADVDESAWSENAWNEELVARAANAAGFWFTGGDQMRITESLQDEDGKDSPLLTLIRERQRAGAVIGGSSAGAAIMGRKMIAGGISFTALLEPLAGAYTTTEAQDSGRLYLHRGLGFLPKGMVDQHFDRKARLGRLVRAMAATGQRFGFGVDENTALLVAAGDDRGEVIGSGSVTLLDAANAQFGFDTERLAVNVVLSVIPAGVTFRLSDFTVLDGQGEPTIGREYFSYSPLQGGGMALANPRLDQALGFDLLDNDSTRVLDRYSLDKAGRVLIYRFTQTGNSAGFWLSEGSDDRYTVSRLRFDILRSRLGTGAH